MTSLAIELNDTGLVVLGEPRPAAEATPPSPGMALFDGERLLTGVDAMRRARLTPRFIHNRFWDELDTLPLPRPFPRDLSRADLVHAHLEAIWQSVPSGVDEVILAVPGFHVDQELGLLLGIARSCGIPVSGMVDSALAASALGFAGETLIHLDLHFHRTVATKLRQSDVIQRGRVEWNDRVGLIALYECWVKLIAQTFVRETRFDPLHLAETEQNLYLKLPGWLDGLRGRDNTVIAMEAGGKKYGIELAREQIVRSAAPYYDHIVRLLASLQATGDPTAILVSHRLLGLPGLEKRLSDDWDSELIRLPSIAATSGALRHKDWIRSGPEAEEVKFITQLPLDHPGSMEAGFPSSGEDLSSGTSRSVPTHVLYDGLAHPIESEPLRLGVAIPEGDRGVNLTGTTAGVSRLHCSIYRLEGRVWIEDHSTYGTFVNGRRVNGRVDLAAGDRLRLGSPGIEVQLLTVVESNGASQD